MSNKSQELIRNLHNEIRRRSKELQEKLLQYEEALKHIKNTTCIRMEVDFKPDSICCAGPGCPGWVAARVLKGLSWKEEHVVQE